MGKGSVLEKLGLKRPPRLTVGQFRDRVVSAIRRRKPEGRLDVVGDAEIVDWEGRVTTVGRAYDHYLASPRDLDLLIGQVADLVLVDSPEPTAADLVVLVRPDAFQVGVQEGDKEQGLARPIAGRLVAVVASDSPTRYVFSTARELRAQLGMSDDEIWKRALANTRRLVGYEATPVQLGKIGEVVTGVGLASSLLADEEVWNAPEMACCGPLLVAPIERDKLVMTPLEDAAAAAHLRRWHERYRPGPDWLADILLIRRDGAWEVLD